MMVGVVLPVGYMFRTRGYLHLNSFSADEHDHFLGEIEFRTKTMMMTWTSALHWAATFPVHCFLTKPAMVMLPRLLNHQGTSAVLLRRYSSFSLTYQAPQAVKDPARLLPDDKPLGIQIPSDTFGSWEGGGSQRSLLLVDGNAILYRAYYKILTKVHYGGLKDMGSEGDWVLTVITALSTILRLLDIKPTHVAAAFDYKGLTFRHELYKSYKSGRPPTPDTVCQALHGLKPALLAMGITFIEVPGVEADDVIGTLALRAVDAGMNVSIASPDKDFFHIISPQVRLLRFVPRGSGIISFGLKEFAERFGDIQPSQYLDVLALMGDTVDNIPGVSGVGEVTAIKLIKEFGTVENVLENREQVKIKRAKASLLLDDGGVLLSKKLLTLRTDLPSYMLPYSLEDFVCKNPKDEGDQFMTLLQAMSPYVDPSISQDLKDRVLELWERWSESQLVS